MKTEKEFKSCLAALGERIFHLRTLKNITTKDIAARLQLSTVAYRNIERGMCDVSFTKLLHLAEIMEIDFRELVKDVGKKPSEIKSKVLNVVWYARKEES